MRTQRAVQEWAPPASFEEYRVLSLLGRGGMGAVYLGHDQLLDRRVAIKFIRAPRPDVSLREQFFTEARAAARLQHPNVLGVYRIGEIDGHLFIVSEYVRGRSLDTLAKPLPWPRVLELGIALSRALGAAHRRGVLHRDIKPGNAIIGEDGQLKLLDFGLAKLVDAAAARDEPREALGESDPRTLEAGLEMAPTQELKLSSGVLKLERPAPPSSALELAKRSGRTQPHFPLAPQHPLERTQLSATSEPIKGTPLYMAPEIWRGEPASRRSDVYSLGVLLYELCAGAAPHSQVDISQLPEVVNRVSAPPLGKLVPSIEPRFAAIIERCLRIEPGQRFSDGEALREALEAIAQTDRAAPIPEGNPYRGLLPFEAEHRGLFFGRGNEIGTVLERLRSDPFVLITADSGMGKSSLCRAGVLPRVQAGALGNGRQWSVLRLVPGRQPLQALAAALAPVLCQPMAQLMAQLHKEPTELRRLLERHLGTAQGLLLFIDQLEELATSSSPEEAEAFGLATGSLIAGLGGVRLLATVRSDFLARVSTISGLGEEVPRALYLLCPLSRDKLREAIIGPARSKGVYFESEALVEELIESTVRAECGLPLLQFTLAELWDAHKDHAITSAALDEIGGVSGALARHADHVLLGLPEEQRKSACEILLSLVTLDGTRAHRREEELVVRPAARPALEALVRGRLVVVHETGEGAVYQVAHEALIKGWGTLRLWLDQSAELRAIKQSLEVAAGDWVRLGRGREGLWQSRQLSQLDGFELTDVTPRESEFIAASRRQLRRQRLVRWALTLSLPLLLLFGYTLVQLRTRAALDQRVAQQVGQSRDATQRARGWQAEALALAGQAFHSFDGQEVESGELLWAKARRMEERAEQEYSRASQLLEAALTLAPGRQPLRELLAEVIYQRAVQADQDQAPNLRDDMLQRLELYDLRGERLRRFHAPARVRLGSEPAGATVLLSRYVDSEGHKLPAEERELGRTPTPQFELAAGSYLFIFRAPGRVPVRYPVLLERDGRLEISIELPESSAVPPGFLYIPPGRFLFGSADEEILRRDFLATTPLHPADTGAYLIARHETTYADWLEYLRHLPPWEKNLLSAPGGPDAMNGVQLTQRPDGKWLLVLRPGSKTYRAAEGEPLRYAGRTAHVAQDWLRMPVSGISYTAAAAYAAWLDKSGRVPGARLCTEYEWERAARGADSRIFPSGDSLLPQDANFDLTYGKDPSAMGPDEVGAHPADRSPFGVEDLAGNVFEWTTSSLHPREVVARGGAYGFSSLTCRSTNRGVLDRDYRDPNVGFRICATWRSKR